MHEQSHLQAINDIRLRLALVNNPIDPRVIDAIMDIITVLNMIYELLPEPDKEAL